MSKLNSKKINKYLNLTYSYVNTYFSQTPAFVRIIPTDACNLNCSYCWQKKNSSYEMKLDEFKLVLQKAKKLNVGLITFLGGEPMTWPHLNRAISDASKYNILTDLTTNGTQLDKNSISSLGEAGLDYLNISVDTKNVSPVSRKNSIFKNTLIYDLKEAKSNYGMHFRFNSVIVKSCFDQTKELIEFSKKHNVQLSLGYVVPHIDKKSHSEKNIYFDQSDIDELQKIISYILKKKQVGYPIIDPDSYFENIFRFLNKENFWECNYPSRYGWINVTPKGKIRTCTKKMDELDINFVDLDREAYIDLRKTFKDNVKSCNSKCYSNCAYDSYYYTQNKLEMLKKIIKRIY